MSFVNVGLLLTGLLSRIMISGFAIDWTESSAFYCKCRVYINQLSILMSLTCVCLAAIDQFVVTSDTICIIWLLHGIPYLMYYNLIISSKTGQATCSITSSIFQEYSVYGFLLILSGILPLFITISFGLLAYRNIRQLTHREIPLVRRTLDKQMTTMVLAHISFDLFTLVPYMIVSMIALDTTLANNRIVSAYIQFMKIFTIYLYYLYFVCPFYIYVWASERFRRQLIYALFKVHFNQRLQQNIIFINQVVPQVK